MEWVIGITTGIISGLIVGFLFYILAGRDLSREARELKRINGVLLRALPDDRAEIEWDEHGAPNRLHYTLNVGAGEVKITGGVVGLEHRDNDGNLIERRQ